MAKADLDILGLGLEVLRDPVTTPVDVPATVQTKFGGAMNDQAPVAPGLSALAELTGPGILTPITLATTPGHKFTLPPLHEKGEYALQNIRLAGPNGEFLQQAIPSFATITVSDVLKTEVRVRQLTPEELRERGITVDLRNYDVYEYTVIFGVDEEFVEIPYPVIIDKRTHTAMPIKKENGFHLPPLQQKKPPRFTPPIIESMELGPGGGGNDPEPGPPGAAAPRIPVAIVMPNGFGVLHQFFAVILQVSNTSPDTKIQLDNITASISTPQQMRVAKVTPSVTLGQPVPIYDEKTGTTYLVAGARGEAEWSLEALKAGTHPIDITVEADYKQEGQPEFRLRGRASTAIVVNDPRFQITFSHPDNVRVDEPYTAYAFITNLSAQAQHVRLDTSEIPHCNTGAAVSNICRTEGEAIVELDIQPGEMIPVPYKLTSKITGHVFAGAGSANDEALSVSVKLHMGVSASGIPLSPATLVMPYYARFLPADFIAANMQLLGLGYSLAVAPVTKYTAKFPRVIKPDVFQRAQEIARAGQRIFATRASRETNNPEENRDAFFHLALDLLGNIERIDHATIAPDLEEWDELRRKEVSGRRAAAAMARELEKQGLHNGRTPQQFVDDFASAASHRTPFLFAYAHGAEVSGQSRPYALSLTDVTTNAAADVPAEAANGWVRTLPNAEVTRFDAGTEKGELALAGKFIGTTRVTVVPRAASFTLHLIYPDTALGAHLRTDVAITGATPGSPVSIEVARGSRTLVVSGASGTPQVREVQAPLLRVLGAAQDLHANQFGRQVSILFNRPLKPGDARKLRDQFALTINVPKANYSITRKNPTDPELPLQIPAAALQQDARLIDVTFDKPLSKNANYVIAAEAMRDLVNQSLFSANDIVPRVDNDEPGGILTGRVLLGDNTPVPGAEVNLLAHGPQQFDVADANGRFMFEFVPRNIDRDISGAYTLEARVNGRATKVEGAVRLIGEVHNVNLVFLGRGRANGYVKYSDGEPLVDTNVVIGSTLFGQNRSDTTDANGYFEVDDLPVGPLTFAVVDPDGRASYAASAIRYAGEVISQDLILERSTFPGTGTVRVTVRRADTNEVIQGARVGVYTQGYSLQDKFANENGYAEFEKIPAGLISIIASAFHISREAPGIELEMRADQIIEQTIFIGVPPDPAAGYGGLEGVVTRDDPASPGDTTRDVVVAGAIITIGQLPPVTANADGTYVYPDLPVGLSGKRDFMLVFDPATGRKAVYNVPLLFAGQLSRFSPRLSSSKAEGEATIRVRLTSATGAPVTDYRVFEPGFPPEPYTHVGNGVYERTGVPVPMKVGIVAVPSNPDGPYGEQMGRGKARVDFAGQIAIVDMRLPGQGTIITRLELRQPQEACPTTEPCYSQAFGKVAVSYSVWDHTEQTTRAKTVIREADPVTQLNTFTKIPALQPTGVYTDRHPAGFDSDVVNIAYEGDVHTVLLRMETIGDVTGRVFAHDRQTPVSGALVRLENGKVIYGAQLTKPDGSFRFAGVPAGLSFTVVAENTRDGIYRKGFASGQTPGTGGPVSNLLVVMREQSNIQGQVVDAAGNPVPLARYYLHELSWPNTKYGTLEEPLQADINGRFYLTNVFTGPFRITASSPVVQEQTGFYQGTLRFEGDTSQQEIEVVIGDDGLGTVQVRVVDSQLAFAPVENAEVRLMIGAGPFDLGSTDEHGIVTFERVPANQTYWISAYSKAAGRAGSSSTFHLAANARVEREVALEFLGRVSGFVTDPENENKPSIGDPVQIESGQVIQRDSTDGEGKFSIFGVPEGTFKLFVYDLESGRMGFGPPDLFISKVVQEHKNIHLQLEKTAQLTVNAYLPTDNGGQGELAPLVDVLVEAHDYFREAQGNSLVFPKMITRYSYKLTVRELGGEHRKVITSGSWPAGTFAKTHNVTFPSTGTVEVKVIDNVGSPVADAKVTIDGKVIYTPTDGVVRLTGVPFGWISVYAQKGNIGASDSAQLQSRSIPLKFTMTLGTNISVTGFVEAEEGIGVPSVQTRVLVNVTSRLFPGTRRLDTLTGTDGRFTFTGIPVGDTKLSFIYFGPDNTTVGAEPPPVNVPNSQTTTLTVDPVKLDATPPRVLKIVPAANENNVSPGANVVITFSEAIGASFLTKQWFQLIANDDPQPLNVTVQPSLRPDGTFEVTLIPPTPPAGQRYPLKSNMLYRLAIPSGLQDTTGNPMAATVGSSFTTVNYTEPAVVRVTPSEKEALASNATLYVKFNKAIDFDSLKPEYGGVLKLEKLDTRGGVPVAEVPLSRYLDPADPTVIVAAPMGVALEESSFYRLTVDKIRDKQVPPNVQKDIKVVDFFSFDNTPPVARIVSPLPEGEKLVSGVLYTATANVYDKDTTELADDVDIVTWLDADGKFLVNRNTKPYGYSFEAPATEVETTYTLKVAARDLSGNPSPASEAYTWTVVPNAAPSNVTIALTPASAYPTHKVASVVTFNDEGVKVTVAIRLIGKRLDGSDFTQELDSKQITRANTQAPWPSVSFNNALPLDILPGTARIEARVTDVAKTGTASADLEILADTFEPEVISSLPKAETRYAHRAPYTIELKVRDVQTGVNPSTVAFSIAGTPVDPTKITKTVDTVTGIHTFRYTTEAGARNADTRIAIVATVKDQRGNPVTVNTDIIYERVDDATIPQAVWLTPLDGAALPYGLPDPWQATLRIQATDDVAVTEVRFESPRFSTVTLTAPKTGTTNIYEAKVTLAPWSETDPPAPFVIKAIVNDADPAHAVELPITIEPVQAQHTLQQTTSVSGVGAEQYIDKNIVIRGSGVRVTITVPVRFRNLMVLDGATVSTFEETKLDLTITERLFVDADSKIDVSDKGYLGGLRTSQDNANHNTSRTGRTIGGTTTGGATNADGSYAGIGGWLSGRSNEPYGSVTEPTDFGAGGGASLTENRPGGNGGGAALLRGADAQFVIAGQVRANAGGVSNGWAAGSGGSVLLESRTLITSPSTRITANGDDEGNEPNDAGGGGGRIAVKVSERFDVTDLQKLLQARGGRNASTSANAIDGGAGTVFLKRPGATNGELIVSAWHESHPTLNHRTRGTPLPSDVPFDSITIGHRALARFDAAVPANITVDPTALVVGPNDQPSVTIVSTDPAPGSNVAQSTSIKPRFTAQSPSGIRMVTTTLSVQPTDVVTMSGWLTSVPETGSTISIPSNATPGQTTLKLIAYDRAGRSAESAPLTFNIVNNAGPVITAFTVDPADQSYANRTISVSATATDDVAVTLLDLTSSVGTVTKGTLPASAPTMTRTFTVAIPKETPSGTPIVLTLTANDGFPGRTPTTQSHTVVVRKDEIAPTLTVSKPAPNQIINEAAGAKFDLEVVAADAEVAVKEVTATFEGTPYVLTPVAGNPTLFRYTGVNVPDVDGSENVAKSVSFVVTDYEGNTTPGSVTFYIKPLVDTAAPILSWSCSSPNAMYPAGMTVPLRVLAVRSPNTSTDNGTSKVEFSINGGADVLATRTTGTDLWTYDYAVPADTAPGTVINVRAKATSTSNNVSTLLGTIVVVGGSAPNYVNVTNTQTIIQPTDTGYTANTTIVIGNAGKVTIIGPRTLKNIVILSGGRLEQQHLDPGKADLLTVERLYVACGGTIDVSALGYAKNVTYPGAGLGDDAGGGSHIGRGGLWTRKRGGVFGSVYRPMESGGGASLQNASVAGNAGGSVRISATTSAAIDGTIKARGASGVNYGTSAGGSIWITTPTLSGAGSADASGGDHSTASGNSGGSGGGGAIAFEYDSVSGRLFDNLVAKGGGGSATTRFGGAGSIYLKAASAPYGELRVDNTGIATTYGATELPSFGRIVAADVNGETVTLAGTRWLSPAMAGHWVRVTGADGSLRGTWRIESVTNPATAIPVNGFFEILAQDAFAYSGYVIYSPNGIGGKKAVAARHVNGNWEYDNDTTFTPFLPQAGDAIIAAFTKDATAITDLTTFDCTNGCAPVNGLPVLELAQGEILINAIGGADNGNQWWYGRRDNGEMFLRSDASYRGIVLSNGANASIALAGATGVQEGDVLRGVYRFDAMSVKNARVITEDLLEVTQALALDATSTLTKGNDAAPFITPSAMSIAGGLSSPVLTGTTGAVSDPDAPVVVIARNNAIATPTPRVVWDVPVIEIGTRGGQSVQRRLNGHVTAYGISSLHAITGSGFVTFMASQTNKVVMAGLAPANTTSNYAEPNTNAFKLLATGNYEVWANGANANKNGAYTTSTVFRITKTPAAIRWFVNNVQVHEVTANIPAKLIFDVSFEAVDTAELHSIEYDTTTADNGTYRVAAAANGSFSVPISGQPGDEIAVIAQDGHAFTYRSAPTVVATMPVNLGVHSVTFAQPEVTGGRPFSGTVQLKSPAGAQGMLVTLASNSTSVTIPASLTFAAGASSMNFNITTKPVQTETDVVITASWGGASASGTLRLLRDASGPVITITAPAAGTQYSEGATSGIAVEANVVDEDTGVASVTAAIDTTSVALTKNAAKGPNVWTGTIPVPFVDGTENVTKDLVVTAVDNNTNSGTASVQVIVKPVVDASLPTLTWPCLSSGSMYAVGEVVRLKVTAVPPNASNTIQSVQFFITAPDGETTPYTATALANNEYEYLFTVPAVADGASFAVRAVATTVSGTTAELTRNFAAVTDAVKISASTTIDAANTTYENKTVVITAGTTTITGAHTFKRLIVYSGASVTHVQGGKLDVTTTDAVFVACGGAIHGDGKGYINSASYPGETTAGDATGGSHIGRGGFYNERYGTTYGSVYQPQELGASGGCCESGNVRAGGGAIRIKAANVIVDGAIRADAAEADRSGAGGSVWITATRISGAGSISANGGKAFYGTGAGGAIAIETTDPDSVLPPTVVAQTGGQQSSGQNRHGGAGSVYVKKAGSVYGDLTIDNRGIFKEPTILPSLGSGTAATGSAGAQLVTTRSKDIQAFFVKHWVEIYAPDGTLKGTWRIKTIDGPKTVTLEPNGTETIDIAAGDKWQGVYRFDNVRSNGIRVESPDPIRVAGTYTVEGNTETEQITASKVVIKGKLTHAVGASLVINADEVRVESGASIDVSGRGYINSASYPNEITAGDATGGSHIGRGGFYNERYGSTYGSVYQPQELGASGGCCESGNVRAGGGAVRIVAANVVVDGNIRADGAEADRSGAGGSVWITAGRISGAGSITTHGGKAFYGTGAGGAIAIETTDPTSIIPTLASQSGLQQASGQNRHGGAGSVFVKKATSIFGDLTIDNRGLNKEPTILPSLGNGVAQAGSTGTTLVTNRARIQPYFAGHYIEITSGGVTRTARVAKIDGSTITLAPLPNETISVAPGDAWQGVYRFDNVRSVGIRVESADPIRVGNTYTSEGWVETELITTSKLVVKGTLTHAVGKSLLIEADEVRIESGASIDVTGKGYINSASYPGETTAGDATGGSHIGRGGWWNERYGTTYGSVYRPQELGASGGCCESGNVRAGGGAVRIIAANVVVDGNIRADGAEADRSGAGGSVWITAGRITGAGTITTHGGRAFYGTGAGGAIAIETTDPTSVIPTLASQSGLQQASGQNRHGGAGSIFVKKATSVFGDLTIDNRGLNKEPTILPSLGNGVAQVGSSGTTLVTNRTKIQPYFVGHYIELTRGNITRTARVAAIDGGTITLAPLPNETIDVAPNDTWQGVYRFDNVKAVGIRVESPDPIRVDGTYTLEGTTEMERITATNVVVKGTLSHALGQSLSIKATDVRIETGAAISATGKGYVHSASYPGEITAGDATGGSHIGRGGWYNERYGSTYGSVYMPREAGASGGCCESNNARAGGGVVRIEAANLVVDGNIYADGAEADRSGAGGSIWITATRITGGGTISTIGGTAFYGTGAGGAIAIETTDPNSVIPPMRSHTGFQQSSGQGRHGGAGSMFVRRATSVYGDLTVDNIGRNNEPTILPSFGSGSAQAGSSGTTIVTGRTSIQPYFVGHYVEVTSGGVVRTGRIATINGGTITLTPVGSDTIDVAPGDFFQGVYRFDTVKLRTTKLSSGDPLRATTMDAGTTVLDINDGPPVFPAAVRSQIVVQSTATTDSVVAPAGAVTDANPPVKLKATNTRTGVVSAEVTAAANGSFTIPVSGQPGDTFTVIATDSHALPLTSAPIAVTGTVTAFVAPSIELSPSTVAAGTVATAVVRLSPLPQKTVQVFLQSSDSSVTIPASLTFAAGEGAKQFSITTTTAGAVTITATHGTSASATLNVVSSANATLSAITLAATTIEGGGSVNGTVTLGAPAPVGGAMVLLYSSSDRVSVPQSVTVAAGDTEASFPVVTTKVGAATSAIISGTWGESKAATLELTPCASMTSVIPPSNTTLTTVWLEDDAPAGATVTGDASFDTTQAATGSSALHFAPPVDPDLRTWSFTGATTQLAVTPFDSFVFHVLINPCNPPKQLLVSLKSGTTVEKRMSWGEARIDVTIPNKSLGAMPAIGEWVRVEVPVKQLGIDANATFDAMTVQVYSGELWIDRVGVTACAVPTAPPPSLDDNEVVWFDDAVPGTVTYDPPTATRNNWNWVSTQVASGSLSHVEGPQSGLHEHTFYNSSQPISLAKGDMLFTYVFLDPCNPPKQIILGFRTGSSWEQRAYWGDNVTAAGTDGTASRVRMGPLPELGKWVRLEVPAAFVALEDKSIHGAAYALVDGRAWFDRAGRYSRVNLAQGKKITHSATYQNRESEFAATKANDGDLSTINVTNSEANAWLEVDLGSVQPIEHIQVWNRVDCCTERLTNHYLLVSDKPFSSSTTAISQADGASKYHWNGTTSGVGVHVFTVNRTGRYIRLQLAATNFLHVREIQVWAPAASKRVNIAGGGVTSQSSVLDAVSTSETAVDGHYNSPYNWGPSVFRTAATDAEAWWEVDLGKVTSIATIDLLNRYDAGRENLQDFYVFISDVPFTGTTVTEALAQPKVTALYYGSPAFTSHSLYVHRTGRYVRIQKRTAGELSFSEINVWSQTKALGALVRPEQPR